MTGFLRFFAVPVRGSCILKPSGTSPVRGPSKKGNRTETGPDFKALGDLVQIYQSDLDYTFKTERKLLPKWSPPQRVVS